jgi:hypothetical protein
MNGPRICECPSRTRIFAMHYPIPMPEILFRKMINAFYSGFRLCNFDHMETSCTSIQRECSVTMSLRCRENCWKFPLYRSKQFKQLQSIRSHRECSRKYVDLRRGENQPHNAKLNPVIFVTRTWYLPAKWVVTPFLHTRSFVECWRDPSKSAKYHSPRPTTGATTLALAA